MPSPSAPYLPRQPQPSPSHTVKRAVRALLAGSIAVTLGIAIPLSNAAAATLASTAPSGMQDSSQRVQKRIDDMHAKLHIEAGQEQLWQAVAQTMRDNQQALEPLVAERSKNASSASALQDLDSFAAVSEAHAGGIRRFIAAFEPLYTAMSPEQKKEADTLFRSGPGKAGKAK